LDQRRSDSILLAGCAVLSLATRIAVIGRPPETILSRYGSDDMFYYTEVARHIASAQGVSFDGVHPTSGVQPLWALLLTPCARIFDGNPSLALRVDLALVTVLTIASGLLMPRLVSALLGAPQERPRSALDDRHVRALGTLAGCAWLVHPRVLGVTFEGTEGALAALCWQSSILMWTAERQLAQSVRLGVTLGLGTLARIDHLVLVGALVAWPRGCRRSLRRMIAVLVPVGALWGPWPWFCLHTTGSLVPDSGAAKRLAHDRIRALTLHGSLEGGKGWSAVWDRLCVGAHVLRDAVSHLFRAGGHVSRFSAAFVLAMVVSLVIVWRRTATQEGRGAWGDTLETLMPTTAAIGRALWPVFVAVVSVLLAYVFVLNHVRSWYTIPAQLAITIVASALCLDVAVAVRREWDLGRRPRLLALTCAVWFGAAWIEDIAAPRRSWHPSYVVTARRLVAVTRPGARIGAFNSGILGAFASEGGRRVTNLDGVVNHGARLANDARTLTEYITNEGLEYVADDARTIAFGERTGAPGLEARLELVERVPIDIEPGQSLAIWRVRGAP
jgi:hypothetical protein